MKIKDSTPFKSHLAACERYFKKKNVFGMTNGSPLIDAQTVEQHAQEIYNSLTGCGLTYSHAVIIGMIVWEQLQIERDSKTL